MQQCGLTVAIVEKRTHIHTHLSSNCPSVKCFSTYFYTHIVPLVHSSIQTPHGANLRHSYYPPPLPFFLYARKHTYAHTCSHARSKPRLRVHLRHILLFFSPPSLSSFSPSRPQRLKSLSHCCLTTVLFLPSCLSFRLLPSPFLSVSHPLKNVSINFS